MRRMLVLGVVAGLAALVSGMIDSDTAEARPQFKKAAAAAYPDNAAVKKAGCGACHPVKDKKKRNDYGVALGKALGKKNEKNADAIKAAFKKAEAGKSATEGKTFGDLLKAGKLPGGKEAAN